MRASINLACVAALLTGCDYYEPQNLHGSFKVGSAPAKDILVAFADEDRPCESAVLTTITTMDGSFQLNRVVRRSRIDPYVQIDRLCIKERGSWKSVWSDTYAPAPSELQIQCEKLAEDAEWFCTAAMDGRAANEPAAPNITMESDA